MREIKFRGKPIEDYGEIKWFYGNAIITYDDKLAYIEANGQGIVPVEWESVGQYTGLKDKNSKEIYDSCIVTNKSKNMHGSGFDGKNLIFLVDWDDDECCYKLIVKIKGCHGFKRLTKETAKHIEVVGNIYENPELISK